MVKFEKGLPVDQTILSWLQNIDQDSVQWKQERILSWWKSKFEAEN